MKNKDSNDCLNKCKAQIERAMSLLKRNLVFRDRVTLKNVVVTSIHFKDVLESLVEKGVTSEMDFHWLAQMRCYWLKGTIVLAVVTTMMDYGFEYLGIKSRLVITPQTERCFRMLMNTLRVNFCGGLQGPEGKV